MAVAQAARALRASAKDHKRASTYHRQAARRCMAASGQLEEICRKFGIQWKGVDA